MAFTPITLTGSYVNQAGGAASGWVQFQLTDSMEQPGGPIVSPVLIQVTLNGSGAFSQVLEANDDATTTPTQVAYRVVELIAGAPPNIYFINVPSNAGGGTINIASCTRVAPSMDPNQTFVTIAGLEAAIQAAGITGGGGGGSVSSVFGRSGAVTALLGDYSSFYDALGSAASAGATAQSLSLAKSDNLSTVADAGSSRLNLDIPVIRAAAMSTTNVTTLTTAGTPTMDGHSLIAGDYAFLQGQSTASQDGLWLIPSSGAWTRPTDFAHGATVRGRIVFVMNGTSHAGSLWVLQTTPSGVVVDTGSQTWISAGGGSGGSFAPLNSPTFTGVPAAPTAAPGTNTTQIATTAFVASSSASGIPSSAAGAGADMFVTGGLLTLQQSLNVESVVRSQPFNRLAMADGTLPMGGNGISNAAHIYVNDLNPAHGSMSVLLNPAIIEFFGNSTDANPLLIVGSILGETSISWGPGGVTAVDTLLLRSAPGLLTLEDGTAFHGQVSLGRLSTNTPGVELFANTGDSQPIVGLGSVLGAGGVFLGAGGSTSADVLLVHSGTQTLSLSATSFQMTDGTAAHGRVSHTLNAAAVQLFANSTDTQPVVSVGPAGIFGSTGIGFGPGGSSGTDVLLGRIAAGAGLGVFAESLVLADVTAAHGQVALTLNPPLVEVFANSADTKPAAELGTVSGTGALVLGPGGTTSPDVLLVRSGALSLGLTATSFGMTDGTAGHGQILLGLNTPSINVFTTSGDTQPAISLQYVLGSIPTLLFGAGGSTAPDVSLARAGAAAWAMNGSLTRNASVYIATPSSTQPVSASFTVTANAETVVLSSTGAVSGVTASATIASGTNGQVLKIINSNTTTANTMTFTSGSTEKLSLGATTRVVGAGGSLSLVYNTTFGRWVEVGFNAGGN